ncbi:glycosyl transferase family 1 [Betaproteobacteria bacterium]|nr:glycosyl transferase family 1 [Betaproteobacteria bacterium]GHU41870.1 glycosyl transferase family 1 [Betaproteobacteria bacterium]
MRSFSENRSPVPSLCVQKLRVLCFGRFCDAEPGGIQSHVASLLTALQDKVDFVNLVPSRDTRSARFSQGKVPVIRTASWNTDGSLALSPGLIRAAWQQHRMTPFDIVHLHLPDPMSHLASFAIPASVPRIITWHADIVRQKHLLKLYQPWQNRLLQQAAAIIVATPEHLRSPVLSQAGIREKVHVIPFGIDLSAFARPHPQTEALQEKYPGQRIFALGRHVSYKGFDILLTALSLLPTHLSDHVHLLLGGTGPLTPKLQQQAAAKGITARVHFPGKIPEADLPAYYQASDLFCLPSRTQAEAFGIVQMEAMAAGKPVVNTRLGNGVNYVSQDGVTGLTVPPDDPQALATALQTLLQDNAKRQQFGANAQARVKQEFSLEVMGERIEALYTAQLPPTPRPLSAPPDVGHVKPCPTYENRTIP